MDVIQNAAVEAWLNNIGQKLAKTPEANAYPYYFKLVNDESINAFALPGGPMYVHTGLITAAANESQVAGVLAHEMSHVALRHGAAQMSKAQTWQNVLGIAGAAAGMGGGGILTQAVQIGGGLGVSSMLSKFSRDYERDADLNGARMMASAGYNPIELAAFFEKLEAQMGAAAKPKGLEKWMSDHPAPGSRREYIEADLQFYPKKSYTSLHGAIRQKCRPRWLLCLPRKRRLGLRFSPFPHRPEPICRKGFAIYKLKGSLSPIPVIGARLSKGGPSTSCLTAAPSGEPMAVWNSSPGR